MGKIVNYEDKVIEIIVNKTASVFENTECLNKEKLTKTVKDMCDHHRSTDEFYLFSDDMIAFMENVLSEQGENAVIDIENMFRDLSIEEDHDVQKVDNKIRVIKKRSNYGRGKNIK